MARPGPHETPDIADKPDLGDPHLLPILPLVYVAWADGTLSDDELEAISSALTGQAWLDDGTRASVRQWLDPSAPPNAGQLQHLLRTMRRLADALPPQQRSLSDLGLDLAKHSARELGEWDRPEARRALRQMEAALGVVATEASQEIFAVEAPAAPVRTVEPRFDVEKLRTLLDGDHSEVRDRVRTVLRDPGFRYEPGLDRSAYRERVLDWCHRLADAGLGALAFPKQYGGKDDLGAFIAAFETLACFDLSLVVKFGVQFGLFGGSVLRLGTTPHHERFLRSIGILELPGCFAMTETGHGSNVRDLQTVARYDRHAREFEIHTPHEDARKDYIGNAALHGQLATVFAQLDIDGDHHGVHAFLVPIRGPDGGPAPGVRIADCGHKLGLNGVDNGRLWFDHVRVPRESLLDRFATVSPEGEYTSPIASPSRRFFTMLSTLVGGRISVAAAAVTAAKSGLTIAIRYGDGRRQFGPAGQAEMVILDYLTHQRRLMPRLAAAYAFHFATRYLVERFLARSDDDVREVEALAAGIKALSTWQTIETLQVCREACGGQGYLAENRFADLKADTDVFATFEGDNTVLLQLVAKDLLTEYRHQFGEMRFFGILRHLARRTVRTIADLNPLVTRQSDPDHLRDPEFLNGAFRYREERLLGSVARRLKRLLDEGYDSFGAFSVCQDHLVALARAHIERIVVEQFLAGVARAGHETFGEALGSLATLYALWRIESDRGWYLESGYLAPDKSRAIRALVNQLCRDVRTDAVALVAAFGIPEHCLAAPIATPVDG
ncbi:MAG: acyl-CoA dehydrogenase family protein [Gemmatimonadota bacterium]|nr:acyl-CoA dehydrogenase family protein [Gemmatimonadota bacterium]